MAAPFRGFLTSHNGSSVNFLRDGTIFWGDGTAVTSKCATGAATNASGTTPVFEPSLSQVPVVGPRAVAGGA